MGPSPGKTMAVLFFTVVCAITASMGAFGGPSDRVLLSDVNVLTLYKDRMTSGRRSSPVPQLTCVGGTAKGYFTPSVVQCYNRGSDGYDIQWECKADMDNAFRFGSVEVTCEGYDYPDDPYILKGSCGLEYTLDLTEEGYQRYKQQKSHSYGGNSHSSHYDYGSIGKKSKSVVGDLLFLGGIAVVIYVIYKSCLASSATSGSTDGNRAQRDQGDSPPPYSPPPYGFRQEYMPGSDNCSGSSTSSAGCQGSGAYTGTGSHTANNQGGGFWTGAATGGLLGYLFGRNNSYGSHTRYHQPHHGWNQGYSGPNTGWFSGWGSGQNTGWFSGSSGSRTSYGGSSFSGSGGSSGSSSASSGTRTASGFGGTKRR